MSELRVSVLTPSYNQLRWLPDTIASVRSQTYPAVEHIVMDGGSTDGSAEFLASQTGLRFRSEPDNGQSHALNKAFAESSGDVIGWLNSDDAYFDPEAVASVVEVFARLPDVDVVYGHAALVGPTGEILQMMWVPPFDERLLRRINFIIQPAAFIRRSAVADMLADERYDYAMDRELWLRLARTSRFARVRRVLAIDRHQPDRKVYTRPDLAAHDRAQLAEAYGIRLPRRVRPVEKSFKIAQRVAGLSLVGEAAGRTAFASSLDSRLSLAVRQAFVPRRRMPGLIG